MSSDPTDDAATPDASPPQPAGVVGDQPPPRRDPWLTIQFFPDGGVMLFPGPTRFPTEPGAVSRCLGAVTAALHQVAAVAVGALQSAAALLDAEEAHRRAQEYDLKRYLETAPPVSDKEM